MAMAKTVRKVKGVDDLGKNSRIVGYIYETNDYSIFGDLDGNRDTDRTRVLSCKKSYNTIGRQLEPIMVTKQGKVYAIIDGQARKQACQEMNMPVRYFVDLEAGLEECIEVNNTGKKWAQLEFIKSIIKRSDISESVKKDYKELYKFISKYAPMKIPVHCIIKICSGSWDGAKLTDRLKHAEFEFKRDPKEATALLDYIVSHSILLNKCKKDIIIPVIAAFYENPKINNDLLHKRCEENATLIYNCSKQNEAMVMLANVYNEGTNKKLQITLNQTITINANDAA